MLPGYTIGEELFASLGTQVFRAVCDASAMSVIIKIRRSGIGDQRFGRTMENEASVLATLDHAGWPRLVDHQKNDDFAALVTNDIGGIALSRLLASGTSLSLRSRLGIARDLAESISYLHSSSHIHRDINPSNIVYNVEDGSIQIIDLGLVAPLTTNRSGTQEEPGGNEIVGTLKYMAPEQTGRIGRELDERSDLYSIGVTLYELFTGVLPFRTRTDLEAIHAHIAIGPTPPAVVDGTIPETVSRIVMKLLEKSPERRYQTAKGLLSDLERCIASMDVKGEIEAFSPGRADRSGNWEFPGYLVGRDRELAQIRDAYERSREEPGIYLVRGQSGSGKTALCRAFLDEVRASGEIVAAGKFDQLQGQEPYGVLRDMVTQLIRYMLRQEEVLLARWKSSLAFIASGNESLLIDFVPEFDRIVQVSGSPASMEANERARHLDYLLTSFFRMLTRGSRNLILMFDDMQWTDPATLRFFRRLLSDQDLRNCFVLGTVRTEEEEENRLVVQGITNMQEQGVRIESETIGNLSSAFVGRLLENAFSVAPGEMDDLAAVLYRKTEGNAFYLKETVRALCQDGVIRFDRQSSRWVVDGERLARKPVTNNVAELLEKRIDGLPDDLVNVISTGSCQGKSFSVNLLGKIHELEETQLERVLKQAEEAQYVSRLGSTRGSGLAALQDAGEATCAFTHDQLQEAFYRKLDPDVRATRHLTIGRALLEDPGLMVGQGGTFEICDQFNRATGQIEDADEIALLAELNLNSALEARKSGALKAAQEYARQSLEWAGRMGSPENRELLYQGNYEAAAISMSRGEFDLSEEFCEYALGQASTLVEEALVANLEINRHTLEGTYQEAVELGSEMLRSLGVEVPLRQIPEAIAKETETIPTLEELGAEEFVESHHLIDDGNIEAAMKIMTSLFPATHFTNPPLNSWLGARMVNLTLQHGFCAESPKGFANYGSHLALKGSVEEGYQFGKIALGLITRLRLPQLLPRVMYAFLGDLMHWREPLFNGKALLEEACLSCMEYGESSYAGYLMSFGRCLNQLYLDEDLVEFQGRLEDAIGYCHATRNLHAEGVAIATYLGVGNLIGATDAEDSWNLGQHTENEFIQNCESREDNAAIAMFRLLQAQSAYHYGNYEQARVYISTAQKLQEYLTASMSMAMVMFFGVLIDCRILAGTDSKPRSRKLEEKIQKRIQKIERWAVACPENFGHLELMTKGALFMARNEPIEAINALSGGVSLSDRENYHQMSVIGNEMLAEIWEGLGNNAYARHHVDLAYNACLVWNARRKVRQLREKYRFLGKPTKRAGNPLRMENGSTSTSGSSSSRQEEMDFAALSEITKSISQEIIFDQLLVRIAKSVTEISGADRYALLLSLGDSKKLELKSVVYRNSGETVEESRLDDPRREYYPKGIVNYVSRSLDPVRITRRDASNYSDDPYFQHHDPGSILCLPILLQGRLLGVIYLENSELENIFTRDRVETISVICNQAGISIHNALQFDRLEREIEEKTRELKELNENLESRLVKQEEKTRKMTEFRRFVSPPVARMLMSGESKDKLKSHRAEIAILFCDLRGYTAYSESVEPEEAMNLLNEYHAIVGKLVNQYQATIDHRAGDGLMIFLNDPVKVDSPIESVVSMAINLREEVGCLTRKIELAGDEVGFGIGLSCGYCTIGMVGFEGRLDYAASGSHVNLASRLCDIADDGEVLASKRIALHGDNQKRFENTRTVEMKGFARLVEVYRLKSLI